MKIENQAHQLDERKRILDQEIENLEQEIGIIDCNIVIMEDDFRAQRDLKISISAPRSEPVLEKITSAMEKTEKKKAEATELRDSLSRDLLNKIKERDKVLLKREKLQEQYPELLFRLCR